MSNELLNQYIKADDPLGRDIDLETITNWGGYEIARLRQRVAELEDALLEMRMTADAESKDAERWRKVAAAYASYKDPSCDDDTYTFTGTVGRIVEMSDPDDDFTRG